MNEDPKDERPDKQEGHDENAMEFEFDEEAD
jgi:hypothetical protein